MENCEYISHERELGYTENELIIDVYKVPYNANTQIYFDDIDEAELFIIFEEKTQFLECYSATLFCKIKIMKGISPEDLEEKNQNLWDYLSLLEVFEGL